VWRSWGHPLWNYGLLFRLVYYIGKEEHENGKSCRPGFIMLVSLLYYKTSYKSCISNKETVHDCTRCSAEDMRGDGRHRLIFNTTLISISTLTIGKQQEVHGIKSRTFCCSQVMRVNITCEIRELLMFGSQPDRCTIDKVYSRTKSSHSLALNNMINSLSHIFLKLTF